MRRTCQQSHDCFAHGSTLFRKSTSLRLQMHMMRPVVTSSSRCHVGRHQLKHSAHPTPSPWRRWHRQSSQGAVQGGCFACGRITFAAARSKQPGRGFSGRARHVRGASLLRVRTSPHTRARQHVPAVLKRLRNCHTSSAHAKIALKHLRRSSRERL